MSDSSVRLAKIISLRISCMFRPGGKGRVPQFDFPSLNSDLCPSVCTGLFDDRAAGIVTLGFRAQQSWARSIIPNDRSAIKKCGADGSGVSTPIERDFTGELDAELTKSPLLHLVDILKTRLLNGCARRTTEIVSIGQMIKPAMKMKGDESLNTMLCYSS